MTQQSDFRDSGFARVVVTGLGAITPVGLTAQDTFAALAEGRCGIGPASAFDASALTSRIAGEVKGFDPTRFMSAKHAKSIGRYAQLSIAASQEAINQPRIPS